MINWQTGQNSIFTTVGGMEYIILHYVKKRRRHCIALPINLPEKHTRWKLAVLFETILQIERRIKKE
jgi:hypothetical protein